MKFERLPEDNNPVRKSINELQAALESLAEQFELFAKDCEERAKEIEEEIKGLDEEDAPAGGGTIGEAQEQHEAEEAEQPAPPARQNIYTTVDPWNLSRKQWKPMGDGTKFMIRPDGVVVRKEEYEKWLESQMTRDLPAIPSGPVPRAEIEPADEEVEGIFKRNLNEEG